MIHPNLATMLVFLTTDGAVSPAMLQAALSGDVQDLSLIHISLSPYCRKYAYRQAEKRSAFDAERYSRLP